VLNVGLLDGKAIMEGKKYLKRWTQEQEFDFYECEEVGCLAGLFHLATNEWLSISYHSCLSEVSPNGDR